MNFELNEEQSAFQQAARDFATNELARARPNGTHGDISRRT